MGQYYMVVNLDKKEYLYPHMLGNGLKLMEFGSGGGTTKALAVLLSNSNGRGGGDCHVPDGYKDEFSGRWAGDRIVIAGDYAERGDPGEEPEGGSTEKYKNLYMQCQEEEFKNISLEIRELLVASHEEIGRRWDV